MRLTVFAAVLILSAPAEAKPRRSPWLLFPIDVRRFEQVSSKFGTREGKVADAGRARACGWYVTMEHENGWRTVYCHLRSDPRRMGIVEGLTVPVMGVVGEVGSTGHSTGPHLHFSLLDQKGRAQDPLLALYTPAETLRVLKRMGLAR